MEPVIVLAAKEVETLISRYEQATSRLIAAERELALFKEDQYVSWDWVCWYLDVERKAARMMLQEEKLLVYGRKIKKFRRSDVVRFAERHRIKVKDIA